MQVIELEQHNNIANTESGMTDMGRGVAKEETDVPYYIYLIRAVNSRLCGAHSGLPQLEKLRI